MATDINFVTLNNEVNSLFDNSSQHDNDDFYQSDWRFWELPPFQATKQPEQLFNFETYDSEIPLSTTQKEQLYPEVSVPSSSYPGFGKSDSEDNSSTFVLSDNECNPGDYCDPSLSVDITKNPKNFYKVPSSTMESSMGSITAELLTQNFKKSGHSISPEAINHDADNIKTVNNIIKTTDENNKCEVCFAKAGKHNYYGGNVCTSCRGFFRRSVQSKQYPLFVCNTNANNNIPITKTNIDAIAQGMDVTYTLCRIDSKSRKSCKHCRFLRCISCGMRPGWVLSDEDRMKRLLQRNKKRNQLSIKNQITFHFTQEEKQLVERLQSLIFAAGYSAYYETFGDDLEIFRSYVNAIYYRQPIKYRVIKKIENIDKKAMIEKGFHLLDTILDVSKIHTNLKQALVRHNYVALFGFYWAVFCEACDMEEFMSEFMSYGLNHRNAPGVESLLQEMGKLNLEDKKSAWAYDMIYFSPWAPCADIEERHLKLTRRICMWPRMKKGGENKIDRSQLALLTMILLLSKDGIDLECTFENMVHLRAAEENQIKFVMMLHRYLKDKYPNDEELVNTSLANGLMIVSQAKELHAMHSLMLPI